MTKAAATVPTRVRWTAGVDGIAHAHRALWPSRTACSLRAIEERWAHPATSRCYICVLVLEKEGLA